MTEIRVLVERTQGKFVATSFDDVGRVASATSNTPAKAVALVKCRTLEVLGLCECCFKLQGFGGSIYRDGENES